jgi:uncharacterized protein (TIGR00369 family)
MIGPLPPYAAHLGITVEEGEQGPLVRMPPGPHLIGRPGFLHGGAIAGLLEIAAIVALFDALAEADRPRVKPITVTTDFMRGGRLADTFALGSVTRLGARIANVEAQAWQDNRDKPIAAARMNLLLSRGGGL